jgi:hypothetical protein
MIMPVFAIMPVPAQKCAYGIHLADRFLNQFEDRRWLWGQAPRLSFGRSSNSSPAGAGSRESVDYFVFPGGTVLELGLITSRSRLDRLDARER